LADGGNQPIEIKTGKAHTDADFMEAIDQQMNVIDEKVEAKKREDEDKAAAKKVEEEGERITVKTNIVSKASGVDEKPRAVKKTEDSDDERKTLSHEGKKLSPLTIKSASKNDTPQQDSVSEIPKQEGQAEQIEIKKADTKETTTNEETAKETTEQETDNSTVPESNKENVVDEKKFNTKPEKKITPQPLKTFDTTKYHLPIKPTRHHRKHTVHPMTAALLIGGLVIVIGLAAMDMEVLDIGVELPFDLL